MLSLFGWMSGKEPDVGISKRAQALIDAGLLHAPDGTLKSSSPFAGTPPRAQPQEHDASVSSNLAAHDRQEITDRLTEQLNSRQKFVAGVPPYLFKDTGPPPNAKARVGASSKFKRHMERVEHAHRMERVPVATPAVQGRKEKKRSTAPSATAATHPAAPAFVREIPEPQLVPSSQGKLKALAAAELQLIDTIKKQDNIKKWHIAELESKQEVERCELEEELERIRAAYGLEAARATPLLADESYATDTDKLAADMAHALSKPSASSEERFTEDVSGSLMGTPISWHTATKLRTYVPPDRMARAKPKGGLWTGGERGYATQNMQEQSSYRQQHERFHRSTAVDKERQMASLHMASEEAATGFLPASEGSVGEVEERHVDAAALHSEEMVMNLIQRHQDATMAEVFEALDTVCGREDHASILLEERPDSVKEASRLVRERVTETYNTSTPQSPQSTRTILDTPGPKSSHVARPVTPVSRTTGSPTGRMHTNPERRKDVRDSDMVSQIEWVTAQPGAKISDSNIKEASWVPSQAWFESLRYYPSQEDEMAFSGNTHGDKATRHLEHDVRTRLDLANPDPEWTQAQLQRKWIPDSDPTRNGSSHRTTPPNSQARPERRPPGNSAHGSASYRTARTPSWYTTSQGVDQSPHGSATHRVS